jgi:hypothetical protein
MFPCVKIESVNLPRGASHPEALHKCPKQIVRVTTGATAQRHERYANFARPVSRRG